MNILRLQFLKGHMPDIKKIKLQKFVLIVVSDERYIF